MKQHQTAIGKNDEWITPRYILDKLGVFDLDPCSPIDRPWRTAIKHFNVNDDGLKKDWFGRVWLNPPFNRHQKTFWMKKMCEHNDGIMLLPANLETYCFKKYVWGKCSGMLFLDNRPHFHYVDGTKAKGNSGCTIVLIAYGSYNFDVLLRSGLGNCVKEFVR